MIPNKRDLKGYVRYDGSGKVIPGGNILARKKPGVGNWVEVNAYECCPPVSSSPATICVSGFTENSGFNGTYRYVNMSQGHPHYEKDGDLYDIYWDGTQWLIGDVAYSPDDVEDPTLVTLWIHDPSDGDISVIEGNCAPS